MDSNATSRAPRAGMLQGLVLVACSWLSVIASGALLGPVIPTIIGQYGGGSAVEYQIAAIVGMPPLFVALFSWPMGLLADRFGARRMLVIAALFYTAAGVAPYFLQSLDAIVWTRRAVGVAEAAVMTCSYVLIGAYFSGAARERWYALTTGTAPIMALVVIALGGGLGQSDWHNVFLVYTFGLVLFLGSVFVLHEPGRGTTTTAAPDDANRRRPAATPGTGEDGVDFNWARFAGICVLSIFVMTAFLITVIQTGSLMTERGVASPAVIGRWQALASLANPAGAAVFMLLRWRFPVKLLVSLVFLSAGLAAMGLRSDWQSVVWGSTIANFGAGLILPTVVSWGLQGAPTAIRGRVAGILMACNFLGQFLSPYVMVWLKDRVGGLSQAIVDYSVACAIVAVLAAVLCIVGRPRPAVATA